MAAKDPRGSGKTAAAPKPAPKPAATPAPTPAPPAAKNPLAPAGASQEEHDAMANSTQPAPTEKRVRKSLDPLVSVTVHTAFNLTRDSGQVLRYETGVQDMPESDADHFYAKIHADRND